ncbi:iron ABC transporter permease [Brevibacterium samyangense]|uniref:ABC transmembrane type-1 domain-containing protein n=1 Tax=Brevibacterium samyangense TaxID=366888 RepID=A0ABN2TJB2_9MICO
MSRTSSLPPTRGSTAPVAAPEASRPAARPATGASRAWAPARVRDPRLRIRVPWLRALTWIGALVLIALPLLTVLSTGLSTAGLAALRDPAVPEAAVNSVVVAGASAVVATFVALVLAVVLDRIRVPGGAALRWVLLLPFLVPPFIGAMSWIALFTPNGMVNSAVRAVFPDAPVLDVYGPVGVVLLMAVHTYPTAYLLIGAALARIPRSLEEAARVGGSGPVGTFFHVTLPLLRPALVAALVLGFASNLSDFGIPALLGLPEGYTTLTTLVYRFLASATVVNPLPAASAIGVALLTLAALAVWVQARTAGAAEASAGSAVASGGQSVGAPSAGARVAGVGAAGTRVAGVRAAGTRGAGVGVDGLRLGLAVALWVFALAATVLPLVALTVQSVLPAPGVPLTAETVTLENYSRALANPATIDGAWNSLVLAVGAGIGCTVLGLLVAVLVTRTRSWDNGPLDLLGLLPQALPGLVVAVAWLLVSPFLGIFDTLWSILAAYVMAFTALVVQMVRAPLASASASLEEAARMGGAGPARALLGTTVRMVLPTAVLAGVVVALTAVRELTISILLVAPGTRTLGVTIFNLQQAGDFNSASALAVLVAVLGIAGLALAYGVQSVGVRRFGVRRSESRSIPASSPASTRLPDAVAMSDDRVPLADSRAGSADGVR